MWNLLTILTNLSELYRNTREINVSLYHAYKATLKKFKHISSHTYSIYRDLDIENGKILDGKCAMSTVGHLKTCDNLLHFINDKALLS